MRKTILLILFCTCSVLLTACGRSSSNGSSSTSVPTTSTSLPITMERSQWPAGALPVGDGLTALTPTQGKVMSCVTSFNKSASHTGPWIQGSYWYPAQKVAVQGSVTWAGSTTVNVGVSTTTISSNNLPDEPSGIFPIQNTDPAYSYDTNPNAITSQSISITLPSDPQVASTPTCVPMGMIGFAVNGVAIYNALDEAGDDAVAHETQDSCDAHPQSIGQYHYHGPSPCMPNVNTSNLVGYALDGFGIYGEKDMTTGNILHDTDLDACHGVTSTIMWNGKQVSMYHYVMTEEYPYTLGCFKGTPVSTDLTAGQMNEIQSFPN